MPGRNEPCPCGSGKKYKKCCGSAPSDTLYYRRLSDAYDRLSGKLLEFAHATLSDSAVIRALQQFFNTNRLESLDRSMVEAYDPIFYPWFFFNWEIEKADTISGTSQTIAELFRRKRIKKTDPLELSILNATIGTPFSFFEVADVDAGRGLDLRDLLAGEDIKVHEIAGSKSLRSGDIIFGRSVSIDKIGMIIGMGPIALAPRHKPRIIDLRKDMRESPRLRKTDIRTPWQVEIRALYLELAQSLTTPPELRNVDGDPFEYRTLIYEVESINIALNRLADLSSDESFEEIKSRADYDDEDHLKSVEFPWLGDDPKGGKDSRKIVLGILRLENDRLSVEVNSENRERQIREIIETRMGYSAKYLVTEITSMQQIMKKAAHESGLGMGSSDGPVISGELKDQLEEIYLQHWKIWVDEEIPALGGMTPKEAIKTADGREKVEALIYDAERQASADPVRGKLEMDGINYAKSVLGIT